MKTKNFLQDDIWSRKQFKKNSKNYRGRIIEVDVSHGTMTVENEKGDIFEAYWTGFLDAWEGDYALFKRDGNGRWGHPDTPYCYYKKSKGPENKASVWGNMTTEQKREARNLAWLVHDLFLEARFARLDGQEATHDSGVLQYQGHWYSYSLIREGRYHSVTFSRYGNSYEAEYTNGRLHHWVATAAA